MALKNEFEVTTAGLTPISNENHISLKECLLEQERPITFHLKYPLPIRKLISFFINVFVLKTYSKSSSFEKMYWSKLRIAILNKVSSKQFDIVIVHGIDVLPIGVKLCERSGAKLVFNAHEYYPKEFEEDLEWVKNVQPLYEHLCKQYLNKVNVFINVSENIRKEYLKNFGIDSLVINNACDFKQLNVTLCKDKIKVIHHGAALKSRNIELMISCAELLDDRFTMDLMLVPNDKVYYEGLVKKLIGNKKVRLIKPVAFEKITDYINQYDIGLYILPTTNFNNEMALPNKFFEFIQARLMLAISPNPEMALITRKYDLGIISTDFSAECLAEEMNKLSINDINRYKMNSDKAAKEINSEINAKLILDKIKEISLCAA